LKVGSRSIYNPAVGALYPNTLLIQKGSVSPLKGVNNSTDTAVVGLPYVTDLIGYACFHTVTPAALPALLSSKLTGTNAACFRP